MAAIAWYAQQPTDADGLREGWDTFNRLVTLVPVGFIAPLIAIERRSRPDKRPSRLLITVVISILIAATGRLLVDLDVLPSPFAFVAIALFSLTFLAFLFVAVRRSGLSQPLLVALLITTFAMLAVIGSEDAWIWVAAPFGAAWFAIGTDLVRGRRFSAVGMR